MSDSINLQFVLARLDSIQKELGMMRLRDEQREAGYQTLAATLSRQMVETTMALEARLNSLEERLDDKLDTIVNQLADVGLRLDAMTLKKDRK